MLLVAATTAVPLLEGRMVNMARRVAVGRANASNLLALVPPYTTWTPIRSVEEGRPLPLGAVAVGRGENTLGVLAMLTSFIYSHPWVIPCMTDAPERESFAPLLDLVGELRDRIVVVEQESGGPDGDVARIVRAVRRRVIPTPASLALWASQRLKAQELEQPLKRQFEMAVSPAAPRGKPSVATYSRLFRRFGPYSARDWRAIARLARHAQGGAFDANERGGVRLPMRTAKRYSNRYLRMSHHTVSKRLGWEWVLEAALRAGGYV